jgi:hypothetical protein
MAPALRMTHVTKASYKFFLHVLGSNPGSINLDILFFYILYLHTE